MFIIKVLLLCLVPPMQTSLRAGWCTTPRWPTWPSWWGTGTTPHSWRAAGAAGWLSGWADMWPGTCAMCGTPGGELRGPRGVRLPPGLERLPPPALPRPRLAPLVLQTGALTQLLTDSRGQNCVRVLNIFTFQKDYVIVTCNFATWIKFHSHLILHCNFATPKNLKLQ